MNTNINKISGSPSVAPQSVPAFDINQAFKDAIQIPPEVIQNTMSDNKVSNEQISQIMFRLSEICSLDPGNAFTAVALLFLKGAANKKAPLTMAVEVKSIDGKITTVTKEDLMYAYRSATQNNYLRRLAEALASSISKFAENYNLQGDLGVAANNYVVAQGETPLDPKERAWANSFCQMNPELVKEAPRVAKFLATDYQARFNPKKKKKVSNAKKQGTDAPAIEKKPESKRKKKNKDK
jgi:hypothetical protein